VLEQSKQQWMSIEERDNLDHVGVACKWATLKMEAEQIQIAIQGYKRSTYESILLRGRPQSRHCRFEVVAVVILVE
jgi:hypothetical protein